MAEAAGGMPELTPEVVAVLERLRDRGFRFAAFPYYERQIGVTKGNCAALLEPRQGGRLQMVAQVSYLVEGHLGVRVTHEGQPWFVWKDLRVAATAEREAELRQFAAELEEALAARA